MARIGFIGLGRMGRGMATRLLAAGHDVVVHNRTPGRADALVRAGAREAATPAEAVSDAQAVVVMVADDEASRQVWLGRLGVLSGTPDPRAFAIECSTLSHGWVLELAGACRRRGLRYLDCPVTGLPAAAAAGELTLLLGADPGDLEDAGPVLEPLAKELLHFGPVGAGTAYKLVINLMGAVQIAAAAEGLAIAEAAGLDPQLVARAISTSQAASPQVVRNVARMVSGGHEHDVVFSGRLRHKDASYGVRLAGELGLRAPLGEAALDRLVTLLAAGLGEQNESAVITVAREDRRGPA